MVHSLTHLGSFENSLCFCVEIEVAPEGLVEYSSLDAKLLSIHLGKMAHPGVLGRNTLTIIYAEYAYCLPEAPPIEGRGEYDIAMFRGEVESRVIFILEATAPVIDKLLLRLGRSTLTQSDTG